jgi:hypothetical protein
MTVQENVYGFVAVSVVCDAGQGSQTGGYRSVDSEISVGHLLLIGVLSELLLGLLVRTGVASSVAANKPQFRNSRYAIPSCLAI